MPGEYPLALENLTEQLNRLPGIGHRSAERLAMALLDWSRDDLQQFALQLAELKDKIKSCSTCGNLADDDSCRICKAQGRNRKLICVVESARQIPVIEKCGRHKGLYHVLGGKLSPLDGIDLKDLNVESLFERIEDTEVEEIILALSPDVEGEATANYLAEELRDHFDIEISRIAMGIPVGSDMTYADAATMAMAIESRFKVQYPD